MIEDQEPSDQELIAGALRGDNRAFTALMRRHKDWLYRFVRHYVRDVEESYDVVQESFVSAWGALSRYDPERPFGIWLRRIALNKCRDRARKSAVRRRLLGFIGMADETMVPDPTPSVDAVLTQRQTLQKLESAIAQLPASLREPLMLTALDGLSHSEAGDVLGLNPKAVEMRIYRAKKRLAEILEPTDLKDIEET